MIFGIIFLLRDWVPFCNSQNIFYFFPTVIWSLKAVTSTEKTKDILPLTYHHGRWTTCLSSLTQRWERSDFCASAFHIFTWIPAQLDSIDARCITLPLFSSPPVHSSRGSEEIGNICIICFSVLLCKHNPNNNAPFLFLGNIDRYGNCRQWFLLAMFDIFAL